MKIINFPVWRIWMTSELGAKDHWNEYWLINAPTNMGSIEYNLSENKKLNKLANILLYLIWMNEKMFSNLFT